MIPNINARLHITASGESIRGLLVLRLKDYDFHADRLDKTLVLLRADLEAAIKDPPAPQQPPRRRRGALGRHVPMMGGVLGSYGYDGCLPVHAEGEEHNVELEYLRSQIGAHELALSVHKSGRARVQWLHDQFNPSETYDLGTADLAMLGFSGDMHGRPAMIGNIDPLVV